MRRAGEELGFGGREELHQLRKLEPGEFFAFGPAVSTTVQRVHIGEVETHHPAAGGRQAYEAPPPTEKVKRLLPKLSDLPAEAEAERQSMADLKRDLANARRELTLAKKDAPPPSEELIERRVKAATDRLERQHSEVVAGYMKMLSDAGKHVNKAAKILGVMEYGQAEPVAHPKATPTVARPDPQRPASTNGHAPDLEGIRKGARRILAELARRHPLAWTKSQVAQLTGYTASGGTFTAYVGDLKRNGLIEVNGKDVIVTEAGLDAVGEVPEAPATHDEVMAMWREKMRAGEFKLLERIAEAGEDGIERDDLAADTEYTMTGGTFTAYIGTLNRNALIEKRGSLLVPSPMLWPEYA